MHYLHWQGRISGYNVREDGLTSGKGIQVDIRPGGDYVILDGNHEFSTYSGCGELYMYITIFNKQ